MTEIKFSGGKLVISCTFGFHPPVKYLNQEVQMVTVSATYSPLQGQFQLCHYFLCSCESLSPNTEAPHLFSRGQRWASLLPVYPVTRGQSSAQIYILEYVAQRNRAWNLPSKSWPPGSLQNRKAKFTSVPRTSQQRSVWGLLFLVTKKMPPLSSRPVTRSKALMAAAGFLAWVASAVYM